MSELYDQLSELPSKEMTDVVSAQINAWERQYGLDMVMGSADRFRDLWAIEWRLRRAGHPYGTETKKEKETSFVQRLRAAFK